MDAQRFDRLARRLSGAVSRRTTLAALIGAGLAGAVGGEVEARKKRRGGARGKKGRGAASVSAEATCGSPSPSSNLSGCNFDGDDFSGDDLSGSTMVDATFRNATLVGTDLSSSNMKGADFRGADLCGANLRSSTLKNANFRGPSPGNPTNLTRANLSSSACAGMRTNGDTLFCQTRMCDGSVRNDDCLPGVDPATVCCGCGPTEICDDGVCQPCDVCDGGACDYASVPDAVEDPGGPATIRVCAGTYPGQFRIERDRTLVGAGSGPGGTVLDGSSGLGLIAHVFVRENRELTLRDLAITGVNNSDGAAGGIETFPGTTVTLTRVRVANNRATHAGGILNSGALTLGAGTVVTGNTATNPNGVGGILNDQGTVMLLPGSDVSGNTPGNCVDVEPGTGCP